MNAIQWAVFIQKLTPDLLGLGLELYRKFKGNAVEAKEELQKMKNYWAAYDTANVKIDEELEELKQQGK